jgi:hypothetical protein
MFAPLLRRSTHDLDQALTALGSGLAAGDLAPCDATWRLLAACMQPGGSPPVDLLLRTSGETRLSDFLLWQVLSHVDSWRVVCPSTLAACMQPGGSPPVDLLLRSPAWQASC